MVYAKRTRNRKFFKRRPKTGARRVNNRVAKMSDLLKLSRQITATREHKVAFATDRVSFGPYNAPNAGVTQTYRTLSLAIDGSNGVSIPQGAGLSQRVGGSIRIKKVILKMNFIPRPVDPINNPIPQPSVVKLYFGYSKPQVNISRQALPTTALDFFRYGGSASSPTGSNLDLCKTINTDLYTIVKKSRNIKVGNSAYYQSQINNQDWNNNDFGMFATYTADLTKHYIKNQHFNELDQGSSQRGLYCYCTAVSSDGNFSTSLPLEVAYELAIHYTDS